MSCRVEAVSDKDILIYNTTPGSLSTDPAGKPVSEPKAQPKESHIVSLVRVKSRLQSRNRLPSWEPSIRERRGVARRWPKSYSAAEGRGGRRARTPSVDRGLGRSRSQSARARVRYRVFERTPLRSKVAVSDGVEGHEAPYTAPTGGSDGALARQGATNGGARHSPGRHDPR